MAKLEKLTSVIKKTKNLTPTVFELTLGLDRPFDFIPGQFVSAIIPGASDSGKDLRRAYSIASTPEAENLVLCIEVVEGGRGSNYLNSLKEGDELDLFGPYGKFVYKTTPDRHVCFVATGTGIVPFRSILLSQLYQNSPPQSAKCIFGVRSESQILYEQEMVNHPTVDWLPCLSRPSSGWYGFTGRVTHYFKTLKDDFLWSEHDYYLCGGGNMIKEMKTLLLEKGVEKKSIYQEIYFTGN